MTDPLLTLEDARFGYDGRVIVHVSSLALRRGETTLVVGPNGAGKSTLMRGILGLLPLLGGVRRSVPGLRPGFVPQRDAIDPLVPMTAADVVALGTHGRLRAWQRASVVERRCVEGALAACDALGIATQRWGTLSAGQRQRVLIARALAVDPDLLVLDEPTAGIDSATEDRILARIDAIRCERGLAVCIVSHHEETLAGRFDHRLRIARGEAICAEAVR